MERKACAFVSFDRRLSLKAIDVVTLYSLARRSQTMGMFLSTFLCPTPLKTVRSGCDFPLAFPVLVPRSNAYTEADDDINISHGDNGHSNELLLRETAKSLGIESVGTLRPCTGYSMAKGYRQALHNTTKLRTT